MSEILELSSVVADIAAPIEVVWPIMADFEGVERLFPKEGVAGIPPIEKVVVDGHGVGAVRTVYLLDGLRGVERLETMDSLNHTYSYAMLPPLIVPVDDYVATVSAVRLDLTTTRIHYRSQGRLRDMPLAQIRPLLTALHGALIDGARRLSTSQAY
jgi:hypothetical protein